MTQITIQDMANDLVKVVRDCPNCGKVQALDVKYSEYVAWKNGELIQNAFKSLSADQRELLMTGICTVCWDKMFNFEDNEIHG